MYKRQVWEVVGGTVDVVNEDACVACGDCVEECPMGAITAVSYTHLDVYKSQGSLHGAPLFNGLALGRFELSSLAFDRLDLAV